MKGLETSAGALSWEQLMKRTSSVLIRCGCLTTGVGTERVDICWQLSICVGLISVDAFSFGLGMPRRWISSTQTLPT